MKKYLIRKYEWFKKEENLRKLFLFIVLTACIFEFISINTQKKEFINTVKESKHEWRQSKDITEPKEIESWMTFAYINFIFKLPANYLETNLDITSPKYPNISIQRYAKISKIDPEKFLSQLKFTINDYVNSGEGYK